MTRGVALLFFFGTQPVGVRLRRFERVVVSLDVVGTQSWARKNSQRRTSASCCAFVRPCGVLDDYRGAPAAATSSNKVMNGGTKSGGVVGES